MAVTSIAPTTRVQLMAASIEDERLIARFIERARIRSEGTARVYAQAIRRFMAWNVVALAHVQYDHILAYQAAYVEEGGLRGYAAATQARHLMTLKALFGFAVDLGYLARNPTRQARYPTPAARPQPFLTAPEMARMKAKAEAAIAKAHGEWDRLQALRNRALFMLACTTGCRSAELAGLNWRDLFEDPNGLIGLSVLGKGGRVRVVKVLLDVLFMLREYRREMGLGETLDADDAGPLFRNRHGDRLSEKGNVRVVAAIAKAAGIGKKVTPHAIRRGVATLALKNGAPLRMVQAQLGHASLYTTQRYLYELEGLQETAADYLAGAWWEVGNNGD